MGSFVRILAKQAFNAIPVLKNIPIALFRIQGQKPWTFGYAFYKFAVIREIFERDLSVFHQRQLPQGYGFRLDERVVEYPWLFSCLKTDEKNILDAGSSLNHPEILESSFLRRRSIDIVTLAPEEYRSKRNDVRYHCQDLRNTSFPSGYFDAVVSISTIEHIGLDNTFLYSDDVSKKENSRFVYLNAIREFKRVLRQGGTLYLTVPYGQYKNHGWFQVFDDTMIKKIMDIFSPNSIHEAYFKYHQNQWAFASANDCRDSDYFDIHREKTYRDDFLAASRSVACLALEK